MRSDLRKLQGIVDEYMKQHKLSRSAFLEAAGGGLSLYMLGSLLRGKADMIDVPVLDAYARAMHMSLGDLAALIGDTNLGSERGDILARKVAARAASLEGVNRDIFLDKIEEILGNNT